MCGLYPLLSLICHRLKVDVFCFLCLNSGHIFPFSFFPFLWVLRERGEGGAEALPTRVELTSHNPSYVTFLEACISTVCVDLDPQKWTYLKYLFVSDSFSFFFLGCVFFGRIFCRVLCECLYRKLGLEALVMGSN